MARYFFNVHDSTLVHDKVERECVGHDDSRKEAMVMLPAVANDEIPKDGERQAFTILVRSEAKVTINAATLTSRVFGSATTSRR